MEGKLGAAAPWAQLPGLCYTARVDAPFDLAQTAGRVGLLTACGQSSDPEAWLDHVHVDDRHRVESERWAAVAEERGFRTEYRVVGHDGSVRWLLDQATWTADDAGPLLVGLVVDITPEKLAERRNADRLDAIRREQEREQQRDRARDTFVRLFCHDAHAVVRQIGALLERAGNDPDASPPVGELARQVGNLEQLMAGILQLERHDAGATPFRPATVDLSEVVRRVGERTASPLIRMDALTPVTVSGDATLLERVVDNLVRNALTHAPGATVEIRTAGDTDSARLEVTDDGPGIPDARKQIIFDPFVRLAGDDRPGFGIGLSLVRSFVALHGGEVTVEDAPGGGSRFVVALPRRTGASTPGPETRLPVTRRTPKVAHVAVSDRSARV